MSMTAVPISMRLVFAPTAARSGKRRSELAGEVVNAEIRPVRAQLLGRDGQIDGLQERVGRRARLRLRRGRPVPEREEADFFHAGSLSMFRCGLRPSRCGAGRMHRDVCLWAMSGPTACKFVSK